jgi:hypothetical protein
MRLHNTLFPYLGQILLPLRHCNLHQDDSSQKDLGLEWKKLQRVIIAVFAMLTIWSIINVIKITFNVVIKLLDIIFNI